MAKIKGIGRASLSFQSMQKVMIDEFLGQISAPQVKETERGVNLGKTSTKWIIKQGRIN